MNRLDVLFEVQVRRNQEDLVRAKQYRLAKEALQSHSKPEVSRAFVPQRMLYALGVRLSNWGCILQTRFG